MRCGKRLPTDRSFVYFMRQAFVNHVLLPILYLFCQSFTFGLEGSLSRSGATIAGTLSRPKGTSLDGPRVS